MKTLGFILLTGLISWLVPLLISMPFFGADGSLQMDIFLFKSVMLLVSAVAGLILVRWSFRRHWLDPLPWGVVLGSAWLVMNWILDLTVLLPLTGMPFSDWLVQVGLRYALIPSMAILAGLVVAQERSRHVAHR